MSENNVTEQNNSTINKNTDNIDIEAHLAILGFRSLPHGAILANKKILTGKNIIIKDNNSDNQGLSYLATLLHPEFNKKEKNIIIISNSDNIDNIAKLADELTQGGSLDYKPTKEIDFNKSKLVITNKEKAIELSDNIKADVLVLDNLNNNLNSDNLEKLFSIIATEDTQFIWKNKEIPIALSGIINSRFKSKGIVQVDLDEKQQREIEHLYFEISGGLAAKTEAVSDILETEIGVEDKILIFCNNPSEVDILKAMLRRKGLSSEKIVGHVPYRKITSVVNNIKQNISSIVISTDVASRELPFNIFDYVINYSIPNDPEVYLHRSGSNDNALKIKKIFSLVGATDITNFIYMKKVLGLDFIKSNLPSKEERFQKQVAKLIQKSEELEYLPYDNELEDATSTILNQNEPKKTIKFLLAHYFNLFSTPQTEDIANNRSSNAIEVDQLPQETESAVKIIRDQQFYPKKMILRYYFGAGSNDNLNEEKINTVLKEAIENYRNNKQEDNNSADNDNNEDQADVNINPIQILIREHYTFVDFNQEAEDICKHALKDLKIDGQKIYTCLATKLPLPEHKSGQNLNLYQQKEEAS